MCSHAVFHSLITAHTGFSLPTVSTVPVGPPSYLDPLSGPARGEGYRARVEVALVVNLYKSAWKLRRPQPPLNCCPVQQSDIIDNLQHLHLTSFVDDSSTTRCRH